MTPNPRRRRPGTLRITTTAILTALGLAAGVAGVVTVVGRPSPVGAATAATMRTERPITAEQVIKRAEYWRKNPPPGGYSWYTTWHDGQGHQYRTDCSGFVSMALNLRAPGLVTPDFDRSKDFARLSARSQLRRGDIIDAPGAGDGGHVVLFAGWVPGTGKTSYVGYEFGFGAAPIKRVIPYPYFNDGKRYYPYHYKKLVAKAAVGVYRLSEGSFHLDSDFDGAGEHHLVHGSAQDLPVTGDWTGTGRNGVGVYRASKARFYLDLDADGRTDRTVPKGRPGDLPVVGDWTGTGRDGVGVFRPSNGTFYLDTDLDGRTDKKLVFGPAQSGDRPIAGDWTGTGRDGVGVFRPSSGTFYLDTDLDGRREKTVKYGREGDHPISADWTGAGQDGIGLFRPSSGRFYLDTDLDGRSDLSVKYGGPGDRPVS